MIPKFMKRGIGSNSPTNGEQSDFQSRAPPPTADASPSSNQAGATQDSKRRPSVVGFMTKSGQLLTTIQGTLDKQFTQIAEAVHLGSNENAELLSNLPAITSKDFEGYLSLVKEHWSEYRDICSSLLRAKDTQIKIASDIEDGTNAFREIPQVFFNSDYKQSGFEQYQIFTQPLRITVQNQGKMSSVLAGYQRKIEQHLVKHLSNVDGLLRSLMSVAVIQSDIGVALDRARSSRAILNRIKDGEVASGLRILQLTRRRERMRQTLRFLELCEQVGSAKPSVDSLIRVGDFSAATDLVQATKSILGSDLADIRMVENIRLFMDEHGRSIDTVIENEFADLVAAHLFETTSAETDSTKKLVSMLTAMSARELLIPSLQLKLKEVIPKRLKKEMKAAGASAAYLSGTDKMFEFLLSKLSILADFVLLVDQSVGEKLDGGIRHIQRLSCLRLFEIATAGGLVKCSQSIVAKLNDVASETASVVSSQVGTLDAVDPMSVLRIPELRSVQTLVVDWLGKLESLYTSTFDKLGLFDEISFASSILKSASQNGFSPDAEFSVASVASQRLLQFQHAAMLQIDSILSDEKWDKSAPINAELLKMITLIDPTPSAMYASGSDMSDSSPTSSSTVSQKQLRVNRQMFLVVPSAVPVIQLLNECLNLSLAIPGVAVECLKKMASIVRTVNAACRELVLEGQMTVKQKKVINATNLALASQLTGMLAQLVFVMARKFCSHYRIENSLVNIDSSASESDADRRVLVDDPSAGLNELLVQAVMELNDHRMDILMKLADILISRFDHHLKQWLVPGGTQAPIDGVVKDFTQMYKVLIKSLQPENLKRVFSRAFSESSTRYTEKLRELVANVPPNSELACKARIDLLYMYQNMLVGEAMIGVKSALNDTIAEMLISTDTILPLLDKSVTAEAAVMKLRDLLKDN